MQQVTLEEILEQENVDQALEYLGSKRDNCGMDGMYLSELREFWNINGQDLIDELKAGNYRPGIVKNIEIINYKGKRRTISAYNSIDRLVLRAIMQKVQYAYDDIFSSSCYAFRSGYGMSAAVKMAADYMEEGYLWVTVLDLRNFYDSIPFEQMEHYMKDLFDDSLLYNLLLQYLHISIETDGKITNKTKGLVQGSPLSPFLSNLYLNQFDHELEKMEDMLLIEARARQGYYQLFNEIIAVEDFKFTTRSRRPPQDPLNALISFGNTYLYNRVATEINKTSLDIRIGFVHSTNNRSQSLNLDIAEIFKPIIVDRTIFTLINKRMISTQQHFQTLDGGGIYLNADGKRLFLNALDDKMYQKQTEGNKSINYDARIREEVSKIFQQVYYDKKYKPYKYY